MIDSSRHLTPDTQHLNLTGWLLDEARAVLAESEQTKNWPVRIIETAPPQRPAPKPQPEGVAQRQPNRNKSAPPAVHYGAWRVLRCQLIQTGDERTEVELVVAREQVR